MRPPTGLRGNSFNRIRAVLLKEDGIQIDSELQPGPKGLGIANCGRGVSSVVFQDGRAVQPFHCTSLSGLQSTGYSGQASMSWH